MIIEMRRHLQGPIFKVIAWITIFALAGIFSLPSLLQQTIDRAGWVLEVNGKQVDYQQFSHEVSLQRDRLAAIREQYGEYADLVLSVMGSSSDPRTLALDALTKDMLLATIGRAMNLHIDPEFIVQSLKSPQFLQAALSSVVPPYLVDQSGINRVMLNNYLRHYGLSIADFEGRIEQAISHYMVKEIFALTNYLPESAIIAYYNQHHRGKKFSILAISLELFAKKAHDKITPEMIQQFFDQENSRSKRYWTTEKRGVTYWTIDQKNYPISIAQQDMDRYYQENKKELYLQEPAKIEVRHILLSYSSPEEQAAKEKEAESMREQLKKEPARFAALAQKFSDDKKSKENGGLLAPFARGQQSPAFERAAFVLKNDGDISPVIAVENGFEIIQRVSRKAPVYKPFASVKADIEQKLSAQEFFKKIEQELQAVDRASDSSGALEPLMASLHAKKSSKIVSKKETSLISQEAFRLKKIGSWGYFFNESNNEATVVELTSIEEAVAQPLAAVKERVGADLREKKGRELLEAELNQARQSAQSMSELQKRLEGSLRQTSFITPESEAAQELEKEGLANANLFALNDSGSRIVVVGDKTGYLVQLDALQEWNESDYLTQKRTITPRLKADMNHTILEGFIASLHRTATIKTNESLLNLQ